MHTAFIDNRLVRLLVLLVFSPMSLLGQGFLPLADPVADPLQETRMETLEERITRLKTELTKAEAALALSKKEASSVIAEVVAPLEIPKGALVEIKLSKGRLASGFIGRLRGRNFFVTNAHTLALGRGASFKTLDGQEVKLSGSAFLARERDLAIVPIEWTGDFLKVSPSLSFDEVSRGDPVTVSSISNIKENVMDFRGKIDALWPLKLEISSQMRSGNEGCPVVHNQLASVVGIVSHLYELKPGAKWLNGSKKDAIRRIFFRIDGEIEWQQTSLSELYRQGEAYDRFEDRTILLAQVTYMLNGREWAEGSPWSGRKTRLVKWGGLSSKEKERALKSFSSHDSIGYLFTPFEEDFDWHSSTNTGNNSVIHDRFINGLNNELVTDRQSTIDALDLDFFRERYAVIDAARDRAIEILKNVSM